tara:strand:- start:1368 stop:1475 length:108 start_codon:yes stop_codon:yes gene_type:complete
MIEVIMEIMLNLYIFGNVESADIPTMKVVVMNERM